MWDSQVKTCGAHVGFASKKLRKTFGICKFKAIVEKKMEFAIKKVVPAPRRFYLKGVGYPEASQAKSMTYYCHSGYQENSELSHSLHAISCCHMLVGKRFRVFGPGEWTTVKLPWHAFVAVDKAKVDTGAPPLDPAKVRQFGLVLSRFYFNGIPNPNYKPGAFKLEVGSLGPRFCTAFRSCTHGPVLHHVVQPSTLADMYCAM
jgi:Complex I intermediate-associated protein 30 (CIA30)